MKTYTFFFLLFFTLTGIAKDSSIVFEAIHHASLLIKWNGITIYIDPSGAKADYKSCPAPDIVLITHTHGDHLNPELLNVLKTDETTVIGNNKAIKQLGYGIEMMNFEKTITYGIQIEAVPMYNTTEDRLIHHPRGEGNGYILTLGDERVYVSGDTEDTPEIRNLKNIDYAFVCMNLPFTMTPEQAAKAVLAFKPKNVYPYHYSQKNGFADIEKFKNLVEEKRFSKVIFLDWYPNAVED